MMDSHIDRRYSFVPVEEWGIFPEARPLVIAGPSEVYPVYLILLTVYIVLRSKGRS